MDCRAPSVIFSPRTMRWRDECALYTERDHRMSRAVEVVITASAVLPALASGVGLATLGVGAVAYAAIEMARRLQQDYQDALGAYQLRCAADADQRAASTAQQQALLAAAAELAARTQFTAHGDPDADFLLAGVQRLEERPAAQANVQLVAQCRALREAIAREPDAVTAHLEAYRRLADIVTAATAARPATALAEEAAALRAELQSPWLDAPDCTESRTQLLAQLDALQAVATRQPTLARQGMDMLRQRLTREMQAQVERHRQRRQQAEARRALVGDIFAKLQALSRQPELGAPAQQADALSRELGSLLADAPADEMAQLAQFDARVNALFDACVQQLQEQAVAAIISDQVATVLVELGYQVTQLPTDDAPDDRTLVAAYDNTLGIEFHVGGNGLMRTEMVALTADAVDADAETQEKVCTVIDHVIDALQDRQYGVRERFRKSLTPGERLRVIDAEVLEAPRAQAAVPQQQRIDES